MDGIHDMGGMHGFGPIPIEDDEPVFHAPWEGRIFGINFVVESIVEGTNIDSGRYRIECIDPATYLNSSYYEKWTAALETLMIEKGILSAEEIDKKMADLKQAKG